MTNRIKTYLTNRMKYYKIIEIRIFCNPNNLPYYGKIFGALNIRIIYMIIVQIKVLR